MRFVKFAAILTLTSAVIASSGCKDDKKNEKTQLPPTAVTVAEATNGTVTPVAEYIGQTIAQDTVDLAARVEGFLTKRFFIEGQTVKKGDMLFTIEKDTYEAAVTQAEGILLEAQAKLKDAEIEFVRMATLIKDNAVAQKNYDNALCNKMAAEGKVKESQASLETAKINLGYTDIKAPFDGVVGLATYSENNVVGPNSKKLATIVNINPMRIQFTINELDVLKYRVKTSNLTEAEKQRIWNTFKFQVKFQNGEIYPIEGELSYSDNHINTSTGTLLLQAEFKNPERILTPGMYVKVLVGQRNPQPALLVPRKSVLDNQAGSYVFTVDKENKIVTKQVKTGTVSGTFVQIISGLKEGELIVVDGLQKVRNGMTVKASLDKSYSQQAGKVEADAGKGNAK